MNVAIVAKFKQGDLWQAMQSRGWTLGDLAKHLGVNYQRACQLVNMNVGTSGISERLETKLMELTGKTVEQLFPDWVRTREFKDRKKEVTAYRQADAATLQGSGIRCLPVSSMNELDEERLESILVAAADLDDEDLGVFELVATQELTLDEAGEILGISRERVRQKFLRVKKAIQQRLGFYRPLEVSTYKVYAMPPSWFGNRRVFLIAARTNADAEDRIAEVFRQYEPDLRIEQVASAHRHYEISEDAVYEANYEYASAQRFKRLDWTVPPIPMRWSNTPKSKWELMDEGII